MDFTYIFGMIMLLFCLYLRPPMPPDLIIELIDASNLNSRACVFADCADV